MVFGSGCGKESTPTGEETKKTLTCEEAKKLIEEAKKTQEAFHKAIQSKNKQVAEKIRDKVHQDCLDINNVTEKCEIDLDDNKMTDISKPENKFNCKEIIEDANKEIAKIK